MPQSSVAVSREPKIRRQTELQSIARTRVTQRLAQRLTLDYIAKPPSTGIDARSDSIHTSLYDGSDHRIVLRDHEYLAHPFAITLFESKVYWTDWRVNLLISADKWHGRNVSEVTHTITQPFDIHIYHPSRQPYAKNPCAVDNGGCSQLCLISFNKTSGCRCAYLFTMTEDGKACKPLKEFLLYSQQKEILGISLRPPYYTVMPSITAVDNVSSVDYDTRDEQLYWTDVTSSKISRIHTNGTEQHVLVDTGIPNPFAFAIDWISRNMFFGSYDNRKQRISVSTLDGEYRMVIVKSNLSQPNSLAVHPIEGKLYWTDIGDPSPRVEMASMDGTNRQVIVTQEQNGHLQYPTSITVDYAAGRVYWANMQDHSIHHCNLHGDDIRILSVSPLNFPCALTIRQDRLYYANRGNGLMVSVDKRTGDDLEIISNTSANVMSLRMFDVNARAGMVENSCAPNNGNCTQLCLPTARGQHVCKCTAGFTLNKQQACTGIESFLMYSMSNEIAGISLDPNDTTLEALAPISGVTDVPVVDFHAEGLSRLVDHNPLFQMSVVSDYIFWADTTTGSISRIRRDLTSREDIVSEGVGAVLGIAVDWIAEHVYWTDRDLGLIEVCRLNGSSRYVVLSDLRQPRSIALHPVAGYLFWTAEEGQLIERARLDGTERATIVNSTYQDGRFIRDLAIDYDEQMLYWCDMRRNTVEKIRFDGSGHVIIIESENGDPVTLTVFAGYLYWVDWVVDGGSIRRIDKNNESDIVILRKDMSTTVKDIQVFDKSLQTGTNVCAAKAGNGGCQELCFHVGKETPHCACSHGRIATDGKSCEPYDAFIVYSGGDRIESINIFDAANKNSPWAAIRNETYMKNVIAVAFDFANRRLFYSDITLGNIQSVGFDGTDRTIIAPNQGRPEGLAYADEHMDLYWTSYNTQTISRVNLKPGLRGRVERVLKLDESDRPRSIAIDTCNSYMYWTNWNDQSPSIQRSFLSGYHVESIVTTDIRIPNALTVDHPAKKLYWADARLDKLERCNMDGTGRKVILTLRSTSHPFGLAVYGDMLYFTDWGSRAVMQVEKYYGAGLVTLRDKIPRQPMGLVVVANNTNDCSSHLCHRGNGGCEDVCLTDAYGSVVCACNPGRVLLNATHCRAIQCDNGNCMDNHQCRQDEFACKGGLCIRFEFTCDRTVHCPHGDDEDPQYCGQRWCPVGFFHCDEGRCLPEKLRCDGKYDCTDFVDEDECACEEDEFKCTSGMCILQEHKCDFTPDCPDASDEMGCPHRDCSEHVEGADATSKLINCNATTACILEEWRCNGQNDCWDNSDEVGCPPHVPTTCDGDQFTCEDGECLAIDWVCDSEDDCEDGSDERNCSYTCQEDKFKCDNSGCISRTWVCDGHDDCGDASDEGDQCKTRTCDETEFQCPGTGRCIPDTWRCDGDNDCGGENPADESAEEGCEYEPCYKDYFECANHHCVPVAWKCNGFNECGDQSDEDESICNPQLNKTCQGEDEYQCSNGVCIAEELLCNGWDDCGDSSDELLCNAFQRDGAEQCVPAGLRRISSRIPLQVPARIPACRRPAHVQGH
ncbi:PREDICTED: prolow-density lipoprotein receptor-related protein 1-like [Priapulus caudatus]|uniref:Prolow-density lipoprotein receptor-related protein 1-like n=1 Tax=Priapulus caudatus TaxID=37621 RepID=A0ABM1EJ91_PRICU|nr:PREDICTED: prolow-density lipoprotein receptor-related protein 1-like [Priapulus caudatus]